MKDTKHGGDAADGNGEEHLRFRVSCDTSVYLRCCDHTGRQLARLILPEPNPEDEAIKVAFTHHGHGRHSLKVDWLPLLTMIPGWPWRWLRIKREVRNLWRMLRR